jgi:ParB-like chromosome segregation protein Spo0J
MFGNKKLSPPYCWAPARISTARIDAALAQGAQAEMQRGDGYGRHAPAIVTLRVPETGRIADQWTVQGNDRHTAKFVAAYNARLRELRAAAPPQAGPPPQAPPGQPAAPYRQQGPPDTTGWTTQLPRRPR